MPDLQPAMALLEVHTAGARGTWSVEVVDFPADRLDVWLFGYINRRDEDRSHEMRSSPLTPDEDEPASYLYVGLPELYCCAPEQSH